MRTITPAIGTRPYFNRPGIEASRDGKPSRVTLLKARIYHQVDNEIKEHASNFNTTDCRRGGLFRNIDNYKHVDLGFNCLCCDICSKSCLCGQCDLRLSYFFQLITNFIFIITCASRKLLYLLKHFLHILGNLFLSLPFTILLMWTSAHICSSSFSSSIVHRSSTSFPLLLPGLDSSSPHPKHCNTWAILAQYFILI